MENKGLETLEDSSGHLSNVLQLAMSTALRFMEMTPKKEGGEMTGNGSNASHTSTITNNLREISLEKVSWHDQMDDCWIILYDRVYDITEFLQEHPGGADILMEYAGRDATLAYRGFGHSSQAWHILQRYLIGVLPEKERTQIFTQCELGINFRLNAVS